MTTQTQQNEEDQGVSIEDVYNLLMFDIEPDLTTNHIDILQRELELLPEKERAERLEHYANAWDEFAIAFDKVNAARAGQITELEKKVKGILNTQEQQELADIDTAISKE
ncbi:MAG: hypothetical protein O3A81_01420 [bacterium]|nr:hypothetical protein [bacterium]